MKKDFFGLRNSSVYGKIIKEKISFYDKNSNSNNNNQKKKFKLMYNTAYGKPMNAKFNNEKNISHIKMISWDKKEARKKVQSNSVMECFNWKTKN